LKEDEAVGAGEREATTIYWCPPPDCTRDQRRRNKYKYQAIVEALKQRPGEWAEVDRGYVPNKGRSTPVDTGMRGLGAQSTVRKMEDGTLSTWARWVEDD
jgi:hypothetical protein